MGKTRELRLLIYNYHMQKMNLEKVSEILKNKGIGFEVITFTDEAIAARSEDTSIDHNYDPKNAIKTLVIKTKDGFKAIILKGEEKIDSAKLEAVVGKWTVVSEEILLNEFGFIPGTVCPLALDLPILVDENAMEMSVWSVGTGEIKMGFNVKKDEVMAILKCELGKFAITVTTNGEVAEKLHLITRNCQEVLTVSDLKKLIESGEPIQHYIGFEISGLVHLGTGLMSMGKIADFVKAGVKCKIFLADFHSYLNNKMGGNWENIREATEGYFKEGLIASLKCFGVDESQVEFIMGKTLYEQHPEHWETFMRVGKHITLSRNLRSVSIMGKKQGTEVDMATLFYPPLQVADIFTMNVNLAHAGIDQRKAHVIAREVGPAVAGWTPVAIDQNLIAGLASPDVDHKDEETLKMSKSKPGSAIFVHDTPEEIREKIKKAYGPPKETEFNPLINWVKTLVFWGEETGEFVINRPEKFGGDVTYTKVADLVADYQAEKLFPLDLKNALADWIIAKLEPARKHFEESGPKAGLARMKEMMEIK